MKKIKQQRVTIDDIAFDERAKQFWIELFGIIDILNKANPKNSISDIHNPTITNYLLWRILNELKVLNIKDKQTKI